MISTSTTTSSIASHRGQPSIWWSINRLCERSSSWFISTNVTTNHYSTILFHTFALSSGASKIESMIFGGRSRPFHLLRHLVLFSHSYKGILITLGLMVVSIVPNRKSALLTAPIWLYWYGIPIGSNLFGFSFHIAAVDTYQITAMVSVSS